jgi:TRAP-type C4-dicarboxylate transport system substrate-binding protein
MARINSGTLDKYNPKKGVEKIAILDAAEKHFAKAKDVSLLRKAIRAKLEAQAEFVLWWKTKGPGANHGGSR